MRISMTNEQATAESPEDISEQYKAFWDAKLWRPDGIVDGAEYAHILKDKLSLWIGNETVIDFRFKASPANNLFSDMAVRAVDYQYSTNARALARFLSGRLDTRVPEGLGDTAQEALRNRVAIERYNAERPEKDYPEHTL